ncbi:hypothetical protein PGTUg99_035653 [Puccinia graminis f. sp. tritici]|uniref:Uncharacterized protein n=1 Tax=Puccinia graminis f. sp. tritici TaxID=56615 RepID=A0A5B0Q9G0_PUCGR|nr:hypothetical protein PGTUg99_035653 [Puccinia graminis f. sp. tritici]
MGWGFDFYQAIRKNPGGATSGLSVTSCCPLSAASVPTPRRQKPCGAHTPEALSDMVDWVKLAYRKLGQAGAQSIFNKLIGFESCQDFNALSTVSAS